MATLSGREINLLEIPPCQVKIALRDDFATTCAARGVKRVVSRLDQNQPEVVELLDKGLALSPSQRLYRSNKLNHVCKTPWLSAFSGRYWTNELLYEAGLSASPDCIFCQGVRDSLQHRLYFCSHSQISDPHCRMTFFGRQGQTVKHPG